jgi:2-dehydropantoate 2-reductase
MLARAGAPVTLIGRPVHVDAIRKNGLFIDSVNFQVNIAASASTELSAMRDADLVLFCVKTLDTEDTAVSLRPYLRPGAVLADMQNGVDNVDRIRSASGIEALPTVVYVGASMSGPGRVKHVGGGLLVFGNTLPVRNEHTGHELTPTAIHELFTRAGVRSRVSDNIQGELWRKMLLNCAYNAISALGRTKYGPIPRNPAARVLIKQIVDEAIAVATASGVVLADEDMVDVALKLGDAMAEATSSTAQDIARGKRTEIDSLNGYVARLGEKLGVPTPVNHTLHALVKLLEESVAVPAAVAVEV